jgi:hypothetical protein
MNAVRIEARAMRESATRCGLALKNDARGRWRKTKTPARKPAFVQKLKEELNDEQWVCGSTFRAGARPQD